VTNENKFHWVKLKSDNPEEPFEPADVEYRDGKAFEIWFIGNEESTMADQCVIGEEITHVVETTGLSFMTPDRFRTLLKKLQLSQTPDPSNSKPNTSASELLGVGERVVRRWADGSKPIPCAVARVLEIMVAWKIKPRDLKILEK